MKKLLLISLLSPLMALAQTGLPDQAQMDAHKAFALGVSQTGNRTVADKTQTVGNESAKTYMEGLTGIQGVSSAGVGKGGKGAIGASVTASYSGVFSCSDKPQDLVLGGVSVYVQACDMEKKLANVAVCDNRAGVRCKADWKTKLAAIRLDSPTAWPAVGTFQSACNIEARCTLAVSVQNQAVTSKLTLQNDTNTAVAKVGGDSALGDLAKLNSSTEYKQQMKETGVLLNDCIQNDIYGNLAANGTAKTCKDSTGANQAEIAVSGNTSTTDNCTPTRSCKRYAKRNKAWDSSCTRQMTLTNYVTKREFEKTSCTLTRTPRNMPACNWTGISRSDTGLISESGCASYRSSTPSINFGCQLASDSCTSTDTVIGKDGNGVDIVKTETQCSRVYSCYVKGTETSSCTPGEISDGLLIDDAEKLECDTTVTGGGGPGCASWKKYYVFEGKSKVVDGSEEFTPSKPIGTVESSCATQGAGYMRSCDTWWRNRLSDAECITNRYFEGNLISDIGYQDGSTVEGCGYCLIQNYADTCIGPGSAQDPADSCAHLSAAECKLVDTVCLSSEGGLCLTQREQYSCEKSEDMCVEWEEANNCIRTDVTHGVEKLGPKIVVSNEASLNKALVGAGVADAIAQSIEGQADGYVPRIFGGIDSRCRKPNGPFGNLVANNCCRSNLERPGGGRPLHQCTFDEVKLAAAKRDERTHYLGSYCSRRIGPKWARICVQSTETYCVFPGLLPTLIQEQGRIQLSEMASSGINAQVQRTAMQYSYYNGAGAWGPGVAVNGNTVSAWSWPSYCSNAETMDNPNNPINCPIALEAWFATCSKGNCGPLPLNPAEGSESWDIQQLNPLENVTKALSRYAVATGKCDPVSGLCNYSIAAWPAGVGGKAVVSTDLVWPLYSDRATDSMQNLADNIFKPHSLTDGAPVPDLLPVDFSENGGMTWRTVSIPTDTKGAEVSLPGGSDLKLWGKCDGVTKTCEYRVSGTITVTAKPWGSPKNPDCSGFTVGQVSALDFSKMDLSRWVKTIVKSSTASSNADMGEQAKAAVADYFTAYETGGAVKASSAASAKVAVITPREEYGPFDARVTVAGNYPLYYDDPDRNIDPVYGVTIDWGDCNKDTLSKVSNPIGHSFEGTHRYASPDDVCGGGERNLEMQVVVTVTSKSGTHVVRDKIWNIWANFHGTVGNREGMGAKAPETTSGALPRDDSFIINRK